MTAVAGLGTILGVFAHPDDETYLTGGLMALAARAGQRVACVTATRGEAGESADPQRWPTDRLAEIREGELARCFEILGVGEHEWLDYPDGGLAQVDPGPAVDAIAAVIERVGPDTVLTFGPDGMTDHPDHKTVFAWTAEAFARVAPSSRLAVATKTPEWVVEFADLNEGVFPQGLPPVTPRDDLIVDVTLPDDVLELKVRALEAQASQTTGLIEGVGRERYAQWVRHETFGPAPAPPITP